MNTDSNEAYIKSEIVKICRAIEKGGYDPVKQLSEYILSEDPIYIPDVAGARSIIRNIDRDNILKALISEYIK